MSSNRKPFAGMKGGRSISITTGDNSSVHSTWTPPTDNNFVASNTKPFDPNGVYPNLLAARGLHPGMEGNHTPTLELLNKGK